MRRRTCERTKMSLDPRCVTRIGNHPRHGIPKLLGRAVGAVTFKDASLSFDNL